MKLVCTLLLVYGIIFSSCSDHAKPDEVPAISQDSLVRRGAYLVTLAGCGDCHSPKVMTFMGPVPDTTRLFSGHRSGSPAPEVSKEAFAKGWVLFSGENTAMATPGFVSFAANISSDSTGIGAWNFEQFKTAMTKGKYKGLPGGRDLYPPMPWPNYAQLEEGDLQAIFSYLKSTKPIHNIVPPPMLAGSF
jgi:hypothetical protein